MEEAKTMLQLKVNKKLLQNHVSKTSGQVVILKDFTILLHPARRKGHLDH